MADTSEKVVYIPDTMSNWPWPAKSNPLCDEVEAESIAWLASFQPYTPASQKAHNKARLGRLAAFAYADAPRGKWHTRLTPILLRYSLKPFLLTERLRVGTDYMHAVFLLDAYTDMESSAGTREICDIVLDALRNTDKPRPEGELVIGEIFRE